MLSGTFYVISNLSPAFQAVSRANPFFYVISGFRFGFIGQSDIGSTNQAVLHGAIGLGLFNLALGALTYLVLRSGWRLKS
jgi:ABC-2 type transport system permease protein